MKIRMGFVSNSSSSSFVLSVKKNGERCPHCGRGDANIIDMARNSNCSDTEVLAVGRMEVLNHIKEWYGNTTTLEDKINVIEKDKLICCLEISNHDQPLLDELDSKDIIILGSEGH